MVNCFYSFLRGKCRCYWMLNEILSCIQSVVKHSYHYMFACWNSCKRARGCSSQHHTYLLHQYVFIAIAFQFVFFYFLERNIEFNERSLTREGSSERANQTFQFLWAGNNSYVWEIKETCQTRFYQRFYQVELNNNSF